MQLRAEQRRPRALEAGPVAAPGHPATAASCLLSRTGAVKHNRPLVAAARAASRRSASAAELQALHTAHLPVCIRADLHPSFPSAGSGAGGRAWRPPRRRSEGYPGCGGATALSPAFGSPRSWPPRLPEPDTQLRYAHAWSSPTSWPIAGPPNGSCTALVSSNDPVPLLPVCPAEP